MEENWTCGTFSFYIKVSCGKKVERPVTYWGYLNFPLYVTKEKASEWFFFYMPSGRTPFWAKHRWGRPDLRSRMPPTMSLLRPGPRWNFSPRMEIEFGPTKKRRWNCIPAILKYKAQPLLGNSSLVPIGNLFSPGYATVQSLLISNVPLYIIN